MITHKDIEKTKKMYYEQHYTVTEITRILKISRNACYKYLKFVNFNAYIKEKKRAQVYLGECSFIEKGEKVYGKYLVMTFTHSNASYIQLLKNKNAESIVLATSDIQTIKNQCSNFLPNFNIVRINNQI